MPVDPWQNPKVVALLALLHQVQPSGNGKKALCPAHTDVNPSMQIDLDAEDGRILVHCHAGCDTASILRALHLVTEENEPDWSALFLYELIDGKRCVAKYNYVDEHGALLYQKLRFEPKTFQFRKPTQQGGWIPTLGPNTRRVVYHLDEIQQQPVVYIPEGEKDVDNLRVLGLKATCNDSGASRNAHEPKWKADHSNQLQAAGVQMAIVLADNDEAGTAHAMAVARSLSMVGIQAKVLHLPGLPEHGDVTDWIEMGATAEDLQAAAEEAPIVEAQPSSALPPSQLPPEGNGNASVAPTHLLPVEELLLELTDVHDPWAFLTRIQEGIIAGEGGNSENLYEARGRFFDMFCAKTAVLLPHQRDALIQEARTVFHVQPQTLREAIGRLAATGGTELKLALTVLGPLNAERKPEWIAESVIDRSGPTPTIKFLKWNFTTEPGSADPELLTEVTVGTVIYQPYPSALVLDGNMLLPEALFDDTADERPVKVFADYRHSDSSTAKSPREVFDTVRAFIDRYFQVDAVYANVLALMIMESWVFDLVESIGYTRASGDYSSGKSRFLDICAVLMRRALYVAGITAATLYRLMDRYQGTLVIDEADQTQKSEEGQLVETILLVGYKKTAAVPRMIKGSSGEFQEVLLRPYGPKALATRRDFSPALESRCATFTLPVYEETQIREDIPMLLPPEFRSEAQDLQNKLLAWRLAVYNTLNINYRRRISGLSPRYIEVAIPLFSIVENLDNATDTPLAKDLLSFFVQLSDENKQQRSESWEGIVATALATTWARRDRADRISLDRVRAGIIATHPHLETRLEPKTVANIMRKTLKLEVKKSGGTTQVFTSDSRIEELRKTYNVTLTKTPVL